MPRNTGDPPKHEAVDIRFRNGATARGIDPSKYRWSIADSRYPPDYAFDITDWQVAKP